MRGECTKGNLLKAVSSAEKITGKRLALPVLGRIILEAKGKEFFVRSTNLDMAVQIKVPGKVSAEGIIAVSGPVLEAHLSNLPETTVDMETTNESLVMLTSNSSARMATESSDDFPTFSEEKLGDWVSFSMETENLVEAIRSVVYSAAISDIKPELASVQISFAEGELICAATDSFRLAEKKVSLPKQKSGSVQTGPLALVPARSATEISRILQDEDGLVEFGCNQNEVRLKTEKIFISARLTSGNFPPYENIIPKSNTTQAVVTKDELLSAIKLAGVFSDRFHQISLKVLPEDHLFEVGGRAEDKGESTAKIEATTEGLPVDVKLNARYVLDCLTVLTGGDVSIGFNGGDKAMVIRHLGDRSFLYLLMPLHK